MTDTTPPDPRIGPLVDLVQAIGGKYTQLATMVLPKLDDADRAIALREMEEVAYALTARLSEIANMGKVSTP